VAESSPAKKLVEPNVAFQVTEQPTNKVQASTQISAGIGAVFAGVFATYGGDSVREIWTNLMPVWLPADGPTAALVIAAAVGAATWYLAQRGGRAAAYNVLDAPNVKMVAAESQV
jgi:hypothetical protein